MVGASKILTVSYGTFSCTLEGFDEPFNTMKAIAEYFRDLAADDRYFGAEPPQPDAEMLHRIAEREIQRRVEAKVQRNGVILRQTEAEEPSAEAPQIAAPQPAAVEPGTAPMAEAAPAMAEAAAEPAPAAEPVAAAAPVFEVPHHADPVSESVAAKLQRIRAAVASARAAAAHAPEPQAEEAEEVAPEQPSVEAAAEAPLAEAPVADFGFALDISGPLSVEETAQIAEAEVPAAEEPVAEEPVEVVTEAAAQAEAAEDADEALEDAETAAEDAAETHEAERQARMQRRAERRAARAAQREAEEAAAQAEAEEPVEAEAVAEVAMLPEATEGAAEDDAPEMPLEAVMEAPAEQPEEAAALEPVAEAAMPAAPDVAIEPEVAAEPEIQQPELPRPVIRARVIKVRRAEPGARPVVEVQERAAEMPAVAPAEPVSALTEEQEAELMAELAALAEDIGTAEDWAAPAPAPVAALAPVDPDDFADGDYSEVVVDAEEFDADMAAQLEETPAVEPIVAEAEAAPIPADADYAEVPVDTEEFDADLAARIEAEVAPAPELSDAVLVLDAPDTTPAADPDAFADGDYAEVVPESEEPEMEPAAPVEAELAPELAAVLAGLEAPEAEAVTPTAEAAPEIAAEIEPEMAAVLAEIAAPMVAPAEAPAAPALPEAEAEAEVAAVLAAHGAPEVEAEVEPEVEAAAEVEEEIAAEPEPEEAVAAFAPEPEPELPAVAPARIAPAAKKLPDEDLSRLMTEADAQMAGSENRRRISAIAHLKAAVAATVAERRLVGTPEKADETVPYREDLHQAVRPRRPIGAGHHAATARPTPVEARPAPLVLVSEQRVDRSPAEAQAEAAAIRPRRISAATLHAREEIVELDEEETIEEETPPSAAEAASFAEFAEGLGTQGLSDLLEAAAAYTAQVEGRPHFSPPQIMRKISAIGAEGEFSREDRLRVFGRLLRQGKIAKVKRGQYAITEASRYYDKRA